MLSLCADHFERSLRLKTLTCVCRDHQPNLKDGNFSNAFASQSIFLFLLAMAAVLAVAGLWEVRYKTEVPLIKMVNLSFCYSNVPFHIGIDPF